MEKRKVKPVSDSKIQMSILMGTTYANHHGKVHGGNILKLADEAAYVCASKHSGYECVTASIDRVDFYSPVNIGDVLTFEASVNLVGTTSMEIGVKVTAESTTKGTKIHSNTCYITMVAIDGDGKPAIVPDLVLENEQQIRRNKEAQYRRQQRLDNRFQKNKVHE